MTLTATQPLRRYLGGAHWASSFTKRQREFREHRWTVSTPELFWLLCFWINPQIYWKILHVKFFHWSSNPQQCLLMTDCSSTWPCPSGCTASPPGWTRGSAPGTRRSPLPCTRPGGRSGWTEFSLHRSIWSLLFGFGTGSSSLFLFVSNCPVLNSTCNFQPWKRLR